MVDFLRPGHILFDVPVYDNYNSDLFGVLKAIKLKPGSINFDGHSMVFS